MIKEPLHGAITAPIAEYQETSTQRIETRIYPRCGHRWQFIEGGAPPEHCPICAKNAPRPPMFRRERL